jgi:hypothetical protein
MRPPRIPIRVAAACGVLAPVTFAVGLFVGDLAQPDAFSPANDDLSDLGALGASSPWLYNQVAANLSGLLVVCLALGLWQVLGPGRLARSGVLGLTVAGTGLFLDGLLRLDCQGIDVGCANTSWHASAHKIESGVTAIALLLTPLVLAFAFRRVPAWRSAWVPTLLATPALIAVSGAFGTIGEGAATRAGSVGWFVWVGFVGLWLRRVELRPAGGGAGGRGSCSGERLLEEEDVEPDDEHRDAGGDDGRRASVDERAHDRPVATEPQERNERERDPEGEDDLAEDERA